MPGSVFDNINDDNEKNVQLARAKMPNELQSIYTVFTFSYTKLSRREMPRSFT